MVWGAEFTGRHVGSGPKGYSICCGKGKVQLPLLRERLQNCSDSLFVVVGKEKCFEEKYEHTIIYSHLCHLVEMLIIL